MKSAYLAILSLLLVVPPVGPANATSEQSPHCVVEIIGQSPEGQLDLSPAECYETFDEAMRAIGVEAKDVITPTVLETQGRIVLPSATFILAVHYDQTSYNGGSLSVTASSPNCTGGYINFRTHYTNWNNRFESLVYGCNGGPITHWDIAPASGGACSGTQLDAFSNKSTLGAMNNKTSCVVYG